MAFNYRNEAAFSNVFCRELRKHKWFVQRIETGTTGKGVPDIYAVAPNGRACWFELKRIHTSVYKDTPVTIPWRPGQQAWLHEVSSKYHQAAYTIACCNNMILVIRHDNKVSYKENRVWITDPDVSLYFKLVDLMR